MYTWKLNDNQFTLLDRLKICKFFLNYNNFWTQNKYTQKYEYMAAKYVGCKYAVFVSSGSSANQLICQFIKDNLIKNNEWLQKNEVIVNSVTWQSNVSVWVREGFKPVFIDANLNDFCLNYNDLEKHLINNHKNVACVFPTSVLGFTPDIPRLKSICNKYKVLLKFDNCENPEGKYFDGNASRNICSEFTCSTSVFIAHVWNNGQEGGFIFTNNKDEYEYYILARGHGLLRNLTAYDKVFNTNYISKLYNVLVNFQFDFQVLSSNYRGTDISAFCGILNFKKNKQNRQKRIELYNEFKFNLDSKKYYLPETRLMMEDVAFCLPIICCGENKEDRICKVKSLLFENNIEFRSFISGNILRQLPYQKYDDYKSFPIAEELNNFSLYIGLHQGITKNQILNLVKELNKI